MATTTVQLENHPCPLCSQFNDELVLTGHDRLHNLPGEYTVVKCQTCGLMRTNPRPTPETIGFYYPDDYSPYHNTKVSGQRLISEAQPFWKQITKRIFEFNEQRLPSLPPGRMLEVGCASGSFLDKMASQGWEVAGIEFSEKAAESARSLGYSVHTGSLETAPNPKQNYALVVAWMVLEHLHDPILCLKKLHSWVVPEGWLVISVPNTASLEFQLFKDAWFALQLPNHLYHYTPKTLNQVLERGGWKMEQVFHHRVLDNFIASTGYFLQDYGYNKQLSQTFIDYVVAPEYKYHRHRLSRLIFPLSYLVSILGQTGRMTVWAKRSN